jgi:hypothetical protein
LSTAIDFLFDPEDGLLSPITKGIVSLMDSVDQDGISGLITGIPKAISIYAQDVFDKIINLLTFDTSFIVAKGIELSEKALSSVSDYLSDLFETPISMITNVSSDILSEAERLIEKYDVKGIVSKIMEIGKYIFDIPMKLLKGGLSTVSEKVTSLFGDNAVSRAIAGGAKSLSSSIFGSDKTTQDSPIKSSNPSGAIKKNTELSKSRFNESKSNGEKIIIKENQPIIQQQEPQQEIVRRTESGDMSLAFLNTGMSDGVL